MAMFFKKFARFLAAADFLSAAAYGRIVAATNTALAFPSRILV
jgi:hypothetical protein